MGKLLVAVVLVLAVSAVYAQGILTGVSKAVTDLCIGLTGLLPIAAMLMIVFAGVIYAAGQMMGAETRARANVWATAALTGALIAILIAVVAPAILSVMYGRTVACSGSIVPPPGTFPSGQ